MNSIELNKLLPEPFVGREHKSINSEVWNKSLSLKRGESFLVKAGSGSGKSSLCSFLYGLRSDYRGLLSFDGNDVSGFAISEWIECRKSSLSLLFQELRLFPELTAFENIELKNRLTSFKKRQEIMDMLEALGVGDKADCQAGKLSLGEQQRVAFVRSLCQPFDFILLDEPVSHLDAENGAIMATLLQQEAKSQGSGIIVTSVGNNLDMQYDNILCL